MKNRKALHCYLSNQGHDEWHDYAAKHRVSLSALVEALSTQLDNITNIDETELVAHAGQIDADRASWVVNAGDTTHEARSVLEAIKAINQEQPNGPCDLTAIANRTGQTLTDVVHWLTLLEGVDLVTAADRDRIRPVRPMTDDDRTAIRTRITAGTCSIRALFFDFPLGRDALWSFLDELVTGRVARYSDDGQAISPRPEEGANR